jgi:hypothetical protein
MLERLRVLNRLGEIRAPRDAVKNQIPATDERR